MLIISNSSVYLILLIAFFIFPVYIYYGIIQFKKHFLNKRIALLNKIIKIANLRGDEKILDLGTGSGFLALGFAKHLKNGKSIGIDKFSIKNENLITQIIYMMKINFIGNSLITAKLNAKIENVENKYEFIEADITNPLNFSEEYFDIIVSSQALTCIQNQKRCTVFQELNRVLKKGGKIVLFEAKCYKSWDANVVKKFFENIGFSVDIIPTVEFNNSCI